MKVRDQIDSDIEDIQNIYNDQNFDYEFPDLNNPLFITKKIVTDDNGNILGCVAVKLTAEAFLFLPPRTHPKDKIQILNRLNESATLDCWSKGLDQVSCWIPTEIEEKFSKRLTKLGFIKSKWHSWTKNLV